MTYPDTPGFKAAGTSEEAARRIVKFAATIAGLVVQAVRDAPKGLNDWECATLIRRPIDSVQPRLSELVAAGVLVRRDDIRRENELGNFVSTYHLASDIDDMTAFERIVAHREREVERKGQEAAALRARIDELEHERIADRALLAEALVFIESHTGGQT